MIGQRNTSTGRLLDDSTIDALRASVRSEVLGPGDAGYEKARKVWNQTKLEESRNNIIRVADWIIPGHGPMFKNPRKD